MPWYKAGTVSVTQNSNAVIGSGTAFIANSRVGDAFRGPDGGWYEVTNIASDTAMSIAPPYQGATSAGGAYALAPMQGYVKDSADALRALVNQFGGVLAVLGTTPTTSGVRTALNLTDTGGLPEGTNKYYTDARVRAAVLTGMITTDSSAVTATDAIIGAFGKLQAQVSGKAAKGANNDITSLLGLTTALGLGQGGTGRTDGLAWGNLKGALSDQTDLQSALNAKSSLGVGQSWQNMTASRALATTYTNTTGKPITVAVLCGPTSGTLTTVAISTQGFNIPGPYSGVVNSYVPSQVVIIPPGATYSAVVGNGTAALVSWYELR
jgi:hypothetical protein